MRHHGRRWILTSGSVLVIAVLAGCSSAPSTTASGGETSNGATASPRASATSFRGVSVQGEPGQEPTVLIGDETAATSSIQIEDVITGTGAIAGPETSVTVQYVARGAKTKRTFDSSWDRGSAYTYDPQDLTFSAFVDGVPGMREGGRRIVIVPGSLAFGPTPPAGSGLQPDETVVFVIDLVKAG